MNKQQKIKQAEALGRQQAVKAARVFARAKKAKAIDYAGENPWQIPKTELTSGQRTKKEKAE